MKRKLSVCLLAFIFSAIAHGQTTTLFTIDSANRDAYYMETDMPEDDVKDALDDFFGKLKAEKEKEPGFIFKKKLPYTLYKRARIDKMGGDYFDCYFKLETKKQKGPDGTNITLAICKGYKNFISPQDSTKWNEMKAFTSYLRENVLEQYRVTKKITAATKERDKANSKLKDVMAEKAKLEATIADKESLLTSLKDELEKIQSLK